MKTKAELAEIRRNTKDKIALRGEENDFRILVGMATCGIAAGAAPVLEVLRKECESRSLKHVEIRPTGCIGLCRYEPIVEVYSKNGKRITYINVTPDIAEEIIVEHIVNGSPIEDYTVLSIEQNRGLKS